MSRDGERRRSNSQLEKMRNLLGKSCSLPYLARPQRGCRYIKGCGPVEDDGAVF